MSSSESSILSRMHRHALEQQWHISAALQWDLSALRSVGKPVRRSMGNIYSDTARAESLGLEVIARLVALAPEGWHRDFAKLQLADETRHVGFFARVAEELGDISEASAALAQLDEMLRDVSDYHELMLHGHVMETIGRTLMYASSRHSRRLADRGVRLPGRSAITELVSLVAKLIAPDESRHIAFGRHALRTWLSRADAASRRTLESRVRTTAELMYRTFEHRSPDYARFGMDTRALMSRVWSSASDELARLELRLDAEPHGAPDMVGALPL